MYRTGNAGGHVRHVVIFVPGLGEDAKIFNDLASSLIEKSLVCLYYNRPRHLGLDEQADILARELRRLSRVGCWPRVVSHSLGALVAQMAVSRLEKSGWRIPLVLISPTGRRTLNLSLKALSRIPKYLIRLVRGKSFRISNEDLVSLMMNDLGEAESVGALKCFGWDHGHPALRAALGLVEINSISSPVLVFSGTRDHMVPSRVHRQVWRFHKGAELKEVEGAGHLPMIGRHRHELCKTIIEWLNSLS